MPHEIKTQTYYRGPQPPTLTIMVRKRGSVRIPHYICIYPDDCDTLIKILQDFKHEADELPSKQFFMRSQNDGGEADGLDIHT